MRFIFQYSLVSCPGYSLDELTSSEDIVRSQRKGVIFNKDMRVLRLINLVFFFLGLKFSFQN